MTEAEMQPAEESEGTQLTINHDVAADLDSSNSFEGPEKLLEVWFAPSAKSLPAGVKENGLKAVSPSTWESMLDLVNCKVLSVVYSEHVDAYLLSESSMFVFAHKLILKTCGTTTLLLGLHRLLRIAADDAGFSSRNAAFLEHDKAAATPYRVFYSRKNFLNPDRQRGPHRSWKQEVEFLDGMFEGGSAYMVGKMTGDHWYLYMTPPNVTLRPPKSPGCERRRFATTTTTRKLKMPNGGVDGDKVYDETLEVLMTDLCVELAKQFYVSHASARVRQPDGSANPEDLQTTEGHALGTVVSDACGLSGVYPQSIYPDARIDAYLFSPCGFSANGVVPAAPPGAEVPEMDHYFTVHVTPEPHCSFASFETNVPGGQRGSIEVIEQVVNIFRPGRFIMTLFEAKQARDAMPRCRPEVVEGYRRKDRIVYEFDDYDLVFGYYERNDWVGDGVARVGEDM